MTVSRSTHLDEAFFRLSDLIPAGSFRIDISKAMNRVANATKDLIRYKVTTGSFAVTGCRRCRFWAPMGGALRRRRSTVKGLSMRGWELGLVGSLRHGTTFATAGGRCG